MGVGQDLYGINPIAWRIGAMDLIRLSQLDVPSVENKSSCFEISVNTKTILESPHCGFYRVYSHDKTDQMLFDALVIFPSARTG